MGDGPRAAGAGRVVRARRLVHQIGTRRVLLSLAGLVAAVLLARSGWHLLLLADAERVLFDLRTGVAAPVVAQDPRILIVPYTDETLIATGQRSPLDRTVLAKALARLDGMGARGIGIDVLVDQPQPDDARLIATLRAMRTPVALAHASTAQAGEKILLRQQQFLDAFGRALHGSRARPASIVLQTDADDVLRRWPAPAAGPPRLPDALLPGAGFAGYAGSVAFRRPQLRDQPVFATIPIDSFADDALFAVPGAADLLAAQVRGRFVLIGGNIEDIDLFRTPLARLAPPGAPRTVWGVELFAAMLAQMLDGRRLAPVPGGALRAMALLVAGGGTWAGWGAAGRRPWLAAGATAAQLVVLAALPFWLATRDVDTYGLPAAGWLAGWLAAFLAAGAAARALTARQRAFAQSALGRYLPGDIAAEILRNPDALRLHGEKRELFILFSDLEGFTKLSHALPPETVALLLNRYLDRLSEVVLAHGGTIDKFVGDAVVAFWGAPIARADDGRRCVEAAIAMHRAGEAFRAEPRPGVPPIGTTRVGVHWGEAVVGNFGGDGRIQYTALGDAMNTAARLEGANKQTGTGVLVSAEAADRSGLDIFRPLGAVVLRGRTAAIAICEPVPDLPAAERTAFAARAARAAAGEPAAVAELAAEAAARPGDRALERFVHRLEHGNGGHYVLD